MARHTGEDFIDVEGVSKSSVLSLQTAGIDGTESDSPQADCFSGYGNTAFSEQIFDIAMAEIELTMQPDGAGYSIWWESMSLISIHGQGVSISAR